MSKSPEKQSPPPAADKDGFAGRKRRSPLTDYLDASEPLERGGFDESPQQQLAGTPLSGSISDWAAQISRDAAQASDPTLKGEGKGNAKPSKKIPERSSAPTRSARGTSMGRAASPRARHCSYR